MGWPPPGTVVDKGSYRYIVPEPGMEPVILAKEQFAPGTTKPFEHKPSKAKDSNKDVVIKVLKGVEGFPVRLLVTKAGALVVNIFAKTLKLATEQLRTNYGYDLTIT